MRLHSAMAVGALAVAGVMWTPGQADAQMTVSFGFGNGGYYNSYPGFYGGGVPSYGYNRAAYSYGYTTGYRYGVPVNGYYSNYSPYYRPGAYNSGWNYRGWNNGYVGGRRWR